MEKAEEKKESLLKAFPVFRELTDKQVSWISSFLEKDAYPEGEVLFTQGSVGNNLYLIEEGQVEVYRTRKGKEMVISEFGGGDFFGDMAFFDGKPRSASARTLSPVLVWILKREAFEDIYQQDPVAGFLLITEMVREISSRLREANEKFADHVRWGIDIRSIEERLRAAIKQNEEVRVSMKSGGDLVGKVMAFNQENFPYAGLRIHSKTKEYLIPFTAINYITMRDRFGNL